MEETYEPSQPSTGDWSFISELQSEDRRIAYWTRNSPYTDELDLSKGITIIRDYPDPEGLLETAWDDLERFIQDLSISIDGGIDSPEVKAVVEREFEYESYSIQIGSNGVDIIAGDIEGVRRGIYYLEDMLLRSDGPFLPVSTIKRTPWAKNRISRCFFGPIKRPPFNKDELMDEVDYYPDAYLNRLAGEGINILWLTVEFRDLVKTDLAPDYGIERDRRLKKLKSTVEKCRRYGIKVFLFCIEPRIYGAEDPLLLNNPEVGGAKIGDIICFCPFTATSQRYLYETVKSIFIDVPNLGGIINISYGERPTTCLSSVSATVEGEIDCPNCSGKAKSQILEATHIPIIEAMREVNPEAQFISWVYVPQVLPIKEWIYTIPENLPKSTVLIYNFETGGEREQLGKVRTGGDYWHSYIGPSKRYAKMASAIRNAGLQMGAKIQVGCSHEVATVPFVPVPHILWRKYRAMSSLGVNTVMQSWYFGNYPGIMNKAAGELSFADFTNTEEEFLLELGKAEWGGYAEDIVKAWGYFFKGYSNYPMDTVFQYYGPMHDGVVWPLHLFPKHTPLAPTWKLDFPTSGDSIGECMIFFTIEEAISLCQSMSDYWAKGVNILKEIRPHFAHDLERLRDIGVAEALGIQFESGLNILKFYAMRDQILWETVPNLRETLNEMEDIVREEIKRSYHMIELCEFDSRLGFHSEAEGYKYFPEKLRWRIDELGRLLEEDFPHMGEILEQDQLTGENSLVRQTTPIDGPIYSCNSLLPARGETFEWTAKVAAGNLSIDVICSRLDNAWIGERFDGDEVLDQQFSIHLKAGALGYPLHFTLNIDDGEQGNNYYTDYYVGAMEDCIYGVERAGENFIIGLELPLERLPGYRGESALAISLVRTVNTVKGEFQDIWSGENPHIRHRLCLQNYNPSAMGRLQLNI